MRLTKKLKTQHFLGGILVALKRIKKLMKKIGLAVSTVLVVTVIGLIAWAYARVGHSVPTTTPTPSMATVTVEGSIECLPNKDSAGPHTLECAIGLLGDDKQHYGLKNSSQPITLPNGTRVRVVGTLQDAEASDRYDVRGYINLRDMTKL